ncbi:porin [Aquabacterium sp.]|uniref:porin n=1 Tax=Aquabacterium sp. TaxID=1872578 RepID=UPI003D6D463E
MFAKKNVVAAAALTLVAVAAQAQVTAYGNLDVSVGRKQAVTGYDTNGKAIKASRTAVDSSDLSDSFIGFKGQEDLGGGLKAIFKLESELAVDNGAALGGTSAFWSRNATVGLAGGFGTVNLGRFENLFKLEGAAFNPFGSSRTFSTTFGGTLDLTSGSLAPRESWSNGISYVSPSLGGLTLSAQYSAKEAALGNTALYGGGAVAVAANFVAGPLGLSAVVGELRSTNGVTAPAEKTRPWLLGASYDFGAVKLFGQYGQIKADDKVTGDSGKFKGFQLGASVPVSADGAVLVSYGDSKGTEPGVAGSEKNRDVSLGYTHNLSKRTNVYAAAINERRKDTTAAPVQKATITNFAVGVRHSF